MSFILEGRQEPTLEIVTEISHFYSKSVFRVENEETKGKNDAVAVLLEKEDSYEALLALIDYPLQTDSDLEESYDIVLSLFMRACFQLEDPKQQDDLISKLLNRWWAEEGGVHMSLQLLTHFFGLVSALKSPRAGEVLLRWVSLACRHRMHASIAAQASHALNWVSQCALSPSQCHQLYRTMANALMNMHREKEALEWIHKLVKLFPEDALQEADHDVLRHAALVLIKHPKLMALGEEGLLGYVDQVDSALGALVHIVKDGKVEELEKHKALCETHQLDPVALAYRMKLAAAGDKIKVGEPLSYAAFSELLGVTVDQVESLVLAAVGEGAMQAKIDPIAETVRVLHVDCVKQPEGTIATLLAQLSALRAE